MAKPKVFISSTCYDLRDIRDSLSSFVQSFGFEPILSEHGDVFYHPDLHTHEACVSEVGNCQLFILIIGGRFGGGYIYDKGKSITNAEYEASVQKKIPVFTYIKRGVLDNHHTYQTNKDKTFINEIHFPAIQNQGDAASIFEFINRVRRAPVNNGYEPFDTFRDIETHLRKQWAGMFFDFLKNREVSEQVSNTNEAVNEIRSASNKLEEIVKNVYRVIDKENADKNIQEIELTSMAKEYLERMIGECLDGYFILESRSEFDRIISVQPDQYNWYEYLIKIDLLRIEEEDDDVIHLWVTEQYEYQGEEAEGYYGIDVDRTRSIKYQRETEYLYENGYKQISETQRESLLSKYFIVEN